MPPFPGHRGLLLQSFPSPFQSSSPPPPTPALPRSLKSGASSARLFDSASLDPDAPALAPSEPPSPPPGPRLSVPFPQRARLPEPRIPPPEPGTNPIRKSSLLLRAMNRQRRVRRARQLRGLTNRTRTRNSSPPPETHSHRADQPGQAMLGAGSRGRPGAGGAGRC